MQQVKQDIKYMPASIAADTVADAKRQEWIKKLREANQRVLEALCPKLDMNCSTYSELENDKKSIDVEGLKKLTQFYDVSADHILAITELQVDVFAYMKKYKNLNRADVEEI